MKHQFDRVIAREQTAAVKVDARRAVFGDDKVLPLWVADMDFAAPEDITRALSARAAHPLYGYTLIEESLYQSLIEWFAHRHHWAIHRDWVVMAPGVVPSLHAAALVFAEEGEGIIIQPPVYPPFYSAIKKTGRRVVENPLRCRAGRYEMDLAHLEQCAKAGARVLFLCSPHNPVGRVWTETELAEVLAITRRYGVVVISDEIHADLVYPDCRPHTVMARLATAEDQLITAVSPSKTFNIPGLGLSALIIPDARQRQRFKHVFDRLHCLQVNPFSTVAFETGYRQGAAWLDALRRYLQVSRDRVTARLREMPGIELIEPEGTYLLWLDCRGLAFDDAALQRFFVDQAGLGLNPGASFGTGGSGFMRMNIASPLAVLEEGVSQLEQAIAARCR
ncbi:MalY/PatB family protein [Marinobacter sp. X15-166B]|uniref:MalY/PatB family protein n=1 Tax=Marinobacter sp. X15-166B TaxID=1897620 RepID=UPI00085C3C96|nr:PatB family C-S lyase [Marinobacter sp. X15-166B]OEY65884.1 aminotransferase [Marinobacter sp. X15-166B]